MIDINSENFLQIKSNIKNNKSFVVTGITSFFKLILINRIKKYTDKKILFVTSTEQSALKYQNDYNQVFDTYVELLPFQSVSCYEGIFSNK